MRVPYDIPPRYPYFDVGVIALVPDAWSNYWQTRQYILTRLSKYFHVVWCEPAPAWRTLCDAPVPQQQPDLDYDGLMMPGFSIYRPEKWLPTVGRPPFLGRLLMRERLRRARRSLLRRGCRRIILYLWRPVYAPALDGVPFDLSCYHIDDEYTFSEIDQPLDDAEARLILRVDQVFVSSPGLLEKKGHLNPHTVFIPNGVRYDAYVTPCSEPPDLQPIPHPRVGYVGVIKKQLDLALLRSLAQRHRQWSFVLVGPQNPHDEIVGVVQELAHLPNVYFLGGKPVTALPAYTQHMDVCILCYKVNDYTKFIYPLKLHESLASGRPCVGAPIRSLQAFAPLMQLASTPDEWSRAISKALAPTACSVTQVAARRSTARRHDWDRLVERIACTLCDRLGSAYRQRLEKLPPGTRPGQLAADDGDIF